MIAQHWCFDSSSPLFSRSLSLSWLCCWRVHRRAHSCHRKLTNGAAVQIGLWDVKRRAAVVRRVPIFSTGEVMVLLEDALPLRALLAPLDTSSEQLMEALEALQPDRASEFGIGSALHAVMDYLVRRWCIR